ncbi:MAG: hypothetical protein GXP61_02770 [Epsilonproteobacteria bacterium]|nr:hypothetical protein [Campylobacterota bacterium]
MKTYYFTFGQVHKHTINKTTYNKDCVCAIKAKNMSEARDKMFDTFNDKWAFAYEEKPDMSFFPRGIIRL